MVRRNNHHGLRAAANAAGGNSYPMAFGRLPVEVNTHIASFLESDVDLCSFSLVCRGTHGAINCDSSPIWREFFAKHFDLVPNVSNNALRRAYQFRRKTLRRGTRFRQGASRSERDCLQVLKDLLLESFACGRVELDAKGRPISRNLFAVQQFAYSFDITQAFGIMQPSSRNEPLSILTMQVLLAHLQFDEQLYSPTFGFADAQKAMYATAAKAPIFTGPRKNEVNMQWVAHAINFFKFHITRPEEQTLFSHYKALAPEEQIKAWRKPLDSPTHRLGRRWKGIYAYLHAETIVKLRAVPDDEDDVQEDIFNCIEDGDTPFQTLQLAFSEQNSKKVWPALFEGHLQSLSVPLPDSPSSRFNSLPKPTSRTRAQSRAAPPTASTLSPSQSTKDTMNHKPASTHFYASGMDEEKFYAAGWLNTLPPQQGVPGMHRWTMMKYFAIGGDDAENDTDTDPFGVKGVAALDNHYIDEASLWAYEGVVLPGGEIVVGRWWSPRLRSIFDSSEAADLGNVYSGPFMFWCVDEDAAAK